MSTVSLQGDVGTDEHESPHPELDCVVGRWDSRLFGNHRIVVHVARYARAVRVVLPWRRKDENPHKVDLIVVSAQSAERVHNVVRLSSNPTSGEIVFEPVDGVGDYYVYYLPYTLLGARNYPKGYYLPWRPLESPEWRFAVGVDDPEAVSSMMKAEAVAYHAIGERESFAPMGFPASPDELRALRQRHPEKNLFLFPESRSRPVEMTRSIPALWIRRGAYAPLEAAVRRGEFFTFQVGVYAFSDAEVQVDAGAMPWPTRSLLTEGVRADGSEFTDRPVRIPGGEVRALWFVTEVPRDAPFGAHAGSIRIGPEHTCVTLGVTEDEPVTDGGVRDLQSMARLGWLDSRNAQDHSLVAPFQPVAVDGGLRRMGILGRSVVLNTNGFPERIASTFSEEVTASSGPERDILDGPVRLDVGRELEPCHAVEIRQPGDAVATWRQTLSGNGCAVRISATFEADGCLEYRCELTAEDGPVAFPDVRLVLPIRRTVARYLMGLGWQGGPCPQELEWTWDVARKNQDSVWVGDVNAGLQISWKDDCYRRPLNSNWYRGSPLVEPRSWGNGGLGGVRVQTTDHAVVVEAYSGPLRLEAGEVRRFDFRVLVTPFKTISTRRQTTERYYHAPNRAEEVSGLGTRPVPINHPGSPEEIREYGATVVNIHHATEVMPFINDPMLSADSLAAYVRRAHLAGLRAKIYNTVRELPSAAPECQALMALDGEVYARGPALGPSGPNVGHMSLQEHLAGGFIPGYASSNVDDMPIVTSGESRWLNVYVCALDWLARECGIDGVYLDEAGFDRTTMKRVRKVLQRHCSNPLIDLHSASQYREADGFASSANLYMEHFPYVDRLWFSEYIDYDEIDPVRWLVELSGVPFGLLGEMLENGGNPWKGLLFGATARAPRVDLRPLWSFWDSVGLSETRMVGWWSNSAPVVTDHDEILATTWIGAGYAVVALASWASGDVDVSLDIDKSALGFDDVVIESPEIQGFQRAMKVSVNEKIPIPYNQGRVLVLRGIPAEEFMPQPS